MPDAGLDRARYRRIMRFAAMQFIAMGWYELVLPKIGLRAVTERTRTARLRKIAARFRLIAVDLGGLLIKLGQFMSSRLDVLPPEITKELEGLQDEVPAAPFSEIRALAEEELGLPLESVYASVDEDPVAAASLGQAYRARLTPSDAMQTGYEDVILKVQRPGIAGIVAVDLAALRRVARWLQRVRVVAKRVDMPSLVEEFARASLEEIDYLHEASNCERFAATFEKDERVRVPEVVWERTSRRVLTLEDVSAIKITDLAALRAAGINPAKVASVFAAVMLDQLFEHNFFHADPHPGNLFVSPTKGGDGLGWRLTFVDFGMMGEVPPGLRTALRELVLAAVGRDGRGMVEAMHNAGVLLPEADLGELERAVTKAFARFGGMGLAELRDIDVRDLRDFALEFSDLMIEMPFQMPEDYLLIIRAGSLTSGVCSALDPSFNVWDAVDPYAQKMLRGEPVEFVNHYAHQAWESAGMLWRMPRRLDTVLGKAEDGTLAVTVPQMETALTRVERTGRRVVSAMIFAALLVAGSRVHADAPLGGNLMMIGSILPGLHAVFGRRSSK
ncbi:ABC1 kinase family protein [Demequina zhanjiangensis]|uniref:AarF/UbiB family protein n=1 Tax=Demequina zhanjiangensis TaxID=3051659 RepID=A0ABT8FZ19_9MICO|nr:AarF/UbiB family protein [Demequina sp. SYSU T00b26]MDN4472062.1 AarF/UbiB family protein [Demequina sp. SYSU T00b26]